MDISLPLVAAGIFRKSCLKEVTERPLPFIVRSASRCYSWPLSRQLGHAWMTCFAMCLPSVFMTLVIRKTDVGRHWPGGPVAFKAEYPDCGEDEQIVSLASMSSSETQEDIDRLIDPGFQPEDIAVFEVFQGWLKQADWLETGIVVGRPTFWHAG